MQRTPRKRGLFTWSAVIAAAIGLASAPHSLAQVTSGTWTALAHQPPAYIDTMLLLTDGTVLGSEDYVNGNGANWWKLTPDSTGSYINGTWKQVATAHNSRLFFASAVLADGRVLASGGEYSNGGSETTKTEIYDPVANTWTSINPPSGWGDVGDAPCTVRPDGKLLLGSILDTRTAIFDPTTNAFTAGPNKLDQSSTEEAWELLPDNNIIVVECLSHPNSERYVNSSNTFANVGTIPHNLVDPSSFETGAAILCPNGITFAIGATVATDLYNYTTNSWTAGPNPPSGLGAEDAPAALMPNGHVLFSLGPTGTFNGPSTFFEYDPVTNAIVQVNAPPTANQPPYVGRMLLTPSGQILFSVGEGGSKNIYAYTPVGSPNSSWAPTITSFTSTIQDANTYSISGTQFNGLSQDCGYGDDASMATNYPLVQLTNTSSGAVTYCRTHGHSTMAVATGSAIVSTNFDVPTTLTTGSYSLRVIANAIASAPVSVTVQGQATATLSSVSVSPSTVNGGTSTTGTVTLASVQSSDIVVSLSSSNVAAAQVPGTVTIPHGSSSANFTVTTSNVNSDTNVTISATSANTVTTTLTVKGITLTGLSVNPTSVKGGTNSAGTVTMSGNAASGGATVSLSSSNPSVASVPSSVTVSSGQSAASFTITTFSVSNDTTVTISATYNGVTQTANLTVTGPQLFAFSLNKAKAKPHKTVKGTVSLDSIVNSDVQVTLSSTDPVNCPVPPTVTIFAGTNTSTFTFKVGKPASQETVTISATFNGTTLTQTLIIK